MRILKYVFFLLLIVIIGFSIYIATLDGNYNVKDKRVIKAPIEVVFNDVNDFKNWEHWGPWYETDSTIVASFPDVTSGEGASYTWTGKDGDGSMKTISLIPNKEIIQEIDFGRGNPPTVYWSFNKTEEGTEVTWGMKGESSFSDKAFLFFMGGIEKMILPMYKRGLELLDNHILKKIENHSFEAKGVVDFGGGYYLYQTISCKMEDISPNSARMFGEVIAYMDANGITPSGKMFLLNHKWDEINNTTMFSTCVPIKERIISTGTILTGHLEGQKTFKTEFKGNYNYTYDAWMYAFKAIEEQGFSPTDNGEPFEVYTVSPHDTEDPTKWVTEIYIPIQ